MTIRDTSASYNSGSGRCCHETLIIEFASDPGDSRAATNLEKIPMGGRAALRPLQRQVPAPGGGIWNRENGGSSGRA